MYSQRLAKCWSWLRGSKPNPSSSISRTLCSVIGHRTSLHQIVTFFTSYFPIEWRVQVTVPLPTFKLRNLLRKLPAGVCKNEGCGPIIVEGGIWSPTISPLLYVRGTIKKSAKATVRMAHLYKEIID